MLCSGAGGATEGVVRAGLDTLSYEIEPTYVATALEAGHNAVVADMTTLAPPPMDEALLQISPPCQGMSGAGLQQGRLDERRLFDAINMVRDDPDDAEQWSSDLKAQCVDPRSHLIFEVMRWVTTSRPLHIWLEQVPSVLRLWEEIGWRLVHWGYSVWVGNLHAEQYGVPQTRSRAILMASRDGHRVTPPPATHSRFYANNPARLDAGMQKWVSMAEALEQDWTGVVGFARKHDRGEVAYIGGENFRGRDLRSTAEPALTITEKARSWSRFGDVRMTRGSVRPANQPSPTLTGSMDNGNFQFMPGGVPITEDEAAVLQTFPQRWPWKGSRSERFMQIGNAVPPLLSQRITEHLIGAT